MNQEETEANLFTMQLLLPEREVKEWWRGKRFSFGDDEELRRFADTFQVCLGLAVLRMAQLEMFNNYIK